MSTALKTYLEDHLAGANYALSLLADLAEQKRDDDVANLTSQLLVEVGEDKEVLEAASQQLGSSSNVIKETAAWVTQKLSKPKLAVDTPLGLFEAVEVLTLGVNGKRALWNTLRALPSGCAPVAADQLDELVRRAESQMASLEKTRLRLAVDAFDTHRIAQSR